MMVEWVIVEWVRWVVHMYKGKECGRDGGRGAQLMREGCNHVRVTSIINEENHSKATVLRLAQLETSPRLMQIQMFTIKRKMLIVDDLDMISHIHIYIGVGFSA